MRGCAFCSARRWAGQQFVRWTGVGTLRASSISRDRRLAAKKVFERLWVAGTLGGFFSALYLRLPHDLKAIVHLQTDPLDLALRYSFFSWLLTYFFTSTVRKEGRAHPDPTIKDLLFDVVQTTSALTAAAFLGFVRPTHYSLSRESVTDIAVALGAVALISFGSLVIFGCDAGEDRYNVLRRSALNISLVGIACVFLVPHRTSALVLTVEVEFALWVVLTMFIRETFRG